MASELRIIYHQVQQEVIELATYFTMHVTIIYPEPYEIVYTIDGGADWGIVGKARARIGAEQKQTEVEVKALPIRYGRITIPEVKVRVVGRREEGEGRDEELEGWVSGNEQMILVVPKKIVTAVPVYNPLSLIRAESLL